MEKKEKTFKYKGKALTFKTKSFKPFRTQAITFVNAYREYEKDYVKDLQSEIQTFLFSDKKAVGKIVTASNKKDTSLLNKAIGEVLFDNPDYAVKAQELNEQKEIAKELFLTTDKDGMPSDINAKKLCDLLFENASVINHDPQTETEYAEYLKFIFEVFDFFFLKYEQLKSIVRS